MFIMEKRYIGVQKMIDNGIQGCHYHDYYDKKNYAHVITVSKELVFFTDFTKGYENKQYEERPSAIGNGD